MLNNQRNRVIIIGGRAMPMNLRAKAKAKKYNYDQQYLKENMITVGVTFNKRKPDDMTLLEWINDREEKKVPYIKRLIREDMEKFT